VVRIDYKERWWNPLAKKEREQTQEPNPSEQATAAAPPNISSMLKITMLKTKTSNPAKPAWQKINATF
jgi:hypothetical protein